jgi:hypothetical protein
MFSLTDLIIDKIVLREVYKDAIGGGRTDNMDVSAIIISKLLRRCDLLKKMYVTNQDLEKELAKSFTYIFNPALLIPGDILFYEDSTLKLF